MCIRLRYNPDIRYKGEDNENTIQNIKTTKWRRYHNPNKRKEQRKVYCRKTNANEDYFCVGPGFK